MEGLKRGQVKSLGINTQRGLEELRVNLYRLVGLEQSRGEELRIIVGTKPYTLTDSLQIEDVIHQMSPLITEGKTLLVRIFVNGVDKP